MTDDAQQMPSPDELVDRLFNATIQTLELFSVYLGTRLGLYSELAGGPHTPAELASATGIHPRYAREWLEQQAVAGFLEADDGEADGRRYSLPEGYEQVLVDPQSLSYLAPFSLLLAGIARVLPDVVEAYRRGKGVAYADYGPDLREGQAAINRPAFTYELPGWVASMPDVDGRLISEPPARVAEVACGAGWASIGIARAYPMVRVDGFDLDKASIDDARANLEGSGVEDRVSFEVRDAADPALKGAYDLVLILEALHDLARPVEALEAMRAMLVPGGSILVADERVADQFTAPGDEVERMMYGWSILHCLPASMTEHPTAGTGTVIRAGTLRRYAAEGGLGRVEVLPIENDFFRLYRLKPSQGS